MSSSTRGRIHWTFCIGLVCAAVLFAAAGLGGRQVDAQPASEEEGQPPCEPGQRPQPRFDDREGQSGGPRGPRPPRFEDLDTDGDGALSLDETESMPGMDVERFKRLDTDEDGLLTREELPRPPRPPQRGGYSQEGYGQRMPRGGFDERGGGNRPPSEGFGPPNGRNGPQSQGFGERPHHSPEALFDEIDADADGTISRDEFTQFHAQSRPRGGPRGGRGGPEGPGGPQGFGGDRDRPARPEQ